MTDEELIARLRGAPADGMGTENLCLAGADRIEALVKDKERLGREVNMARYGQPDFAWSIHKQAMAELQARAERLEAAMREIESISVHSGGEVLGVTADHWRMAFEQAQDVARAALKGEDHE